MNCWLTSSLCRLRLCRLDSFNFYRFLKSNQNLHAEIFLQCSRYPAKTNFFLLEFTQEPDSSEFYSEQSLFKCSWLLAILNYFMLKLFFWVVLRTHRNHLNFKFTSPEAKLCSTDFCKEDRARYPRPVIWKTFWNTLRESDENNCWTLNTVLKLSLSTGIC